VLAAIGFDDQGRLHAVEINDVTGDRKLAAKLEPDSRRARRKHTSSRCRSFPGRTVSGYAPQDSERNLKL